MKLKEGFQGQRAIILPQTIIDSLEKNKITKSLYLTDIGYYPNAKYHYRKRETSSMQNILIYCVKGKGWFSVNQVKKNINENEFFIIPANMAHAYGSDPKEPWTIYWIHFKGDIAQELIEPFGSYPKKLTPNQQSRIETRNQLFEEIYAVLDMGYSMEHLEYSSLCLQHYLASLKYASLFRDSAILDSKEKDYTNLSIHYMKENIEKKIKVEDIAQELGISTSHYSCLFYENTGYSPINYLNNLRIQTACHYLDFSEMKINQLCHKVGYDDPYYFSRVFSKTMGISPREYKKKKKG